jgi:hypothetical protein
MFSTYAPIIIFCYRRSIKTLLKSLYRNPEFEHSFVYIFSDGAKSVDDSPDVEKIRSELALLKDNENVAIFESQRNRGLANSIIDGVSYVIEKHGSAIVLEDDLEVSPFFLKFMNDSLAVYKKDSRIWSISGYVPPIFSADSPLEADVFLFPRGSSWGWATWADRWCDVDWSVESFDNLKADKNLRTQFELGGNDLFRMLELQMLGKIDSWAIRWCYSQFMHQKSSIYPFFTLVNNLGFQDGLGTHNSRGSDCRSSFTLKCPDVDKLSASNHFAEQMKIANDLSLITRIGYFLKKNGGYHFAKKVYSFFS